MRNSRSSAAWRTPALLSLGFAALLGLASCREPSTTESAPPHTGAGPTPPAPVGKDLFADVTERSPQLAKFCFRNGEEADEYTMLEPLGGGVGVIDYDGDGKLDLVVTGGGEFAGADHHDIKGYPTRIFRNTGDFKFVDVTEQVLPPSAQRLFYSHGVAVCDYDRDGWPDLLITGWGGLALYHNEPDGKGGRKLVDVTEQAGLVMKEHFWATSAAFGDLDGDGFPDLYVCQYCDWNWNNHPVCTDESAKVPRDICPPKKFNAKRHALYRNNGKGGFVDVSTDPETGLRLETNDPDLNSKEKRNWCGKGLAVVMVDIDGDGRPEIYVANDTSGNFLYMNKSTPGHIRLEESASKLGVDVDFNRMPNGSMGADAADIDGSGDPALWVTNYEGELHSLYKMSSAKGKLFFYHHSQPAGLTAIGQLYVGWGTGFLDLDNDGWMDIVIVNGHVFYHPPNNNVRQLPVLFHNRGDGQGKFEVIMQQGGSYFHVPHWGRGLAIADLDNDGLPDIVTTHVNAPPAVLHNICDSGNHWVGVKLVGQKDPGIFAGRDVVGARAVIEVAGRMITQFQKGGGSFLSSRDPRLLFGLGQETKVDQLTVYWPSGTPRVESWDKLQIDRYNAIQQGLGTKVIKAKLTLTVDGA